MIAALMTWASDHWWLAFWLAWWALLFAFGIVYVTISGPLRILSRLLFTLRVVARGYPPEGLDSSGQWKSSQPIERETVSRLGDREVVERFYREEKKT
jgi:hypothetical protein